MDLRFSHVDILVADLSAAVSYYRRALGGVASATQVWHRGDFHVEYVVVFCGTERFMLVQPHSGPLALLMDRKGPGTIYRLCYTTKDIKRVYQGLISSGVKPEDENGKALTPEGLDSPAGIPIMWLPKEVGDLSIEILEEAAMEASMRGLREAAT